MPGKVTAKCVQPVQLFPGFLFFPLIIRRVYQIIKAGTYPLDLVSQVETLLRLSRNTDSLSVGKCRGVVRFP